MRNHWLAKHEYRNQFQWTFAVSRNAIFQLKPRTVILPKRPNREFEEGELIRVVFSDASMRDEELYTFLSDCYDDKRINSCAYLKLLDGAEQPIETWSFDKIRAEDINFSEGFDKNSDGPREIEFVFSARSKVYRDFFARHRA